MRAGVDVSSIDKARGSHPSRGAHFSGALPGSEGDTIMCAVLCVQPLMMWII